MKYLLFLTPVLFSCKTSKNTNCDAYGLIYVERDTIVLTTEHINFDGKCYEDTTMITCVTDTFKIPNKK